MRPGKSCCRAPPPPASRLLSFCPVISCAFNRKRANLVRSVGGGNYRIIVKVRYGSCEDVIFHPCLPAGMQRALDISRVASSFNCQTGTGRMVRPRCTYVHLRHWWHLSVKIISLHFLVVSRVTIQSCVRIVFVSTL